MRELNRRRQESALRARLFPSEKPERLVGLLVAAVFALLMSRLWVGDLFNSYVYMSNDSYDWITQGVALVEHISGQDRSQWPVLRPPLFVFIHALDYLLEPSGLIFLVCQSLAMGATAWIVTRYAFRAGLGRLSSVAAGLGAVFSVLSFFSLWVLSDAIASALMTVSAVFAVERLRAPVASGLVAGLARLRPAILLAILAGITQTYGMIPMLVICAIFAAARLLLDRNVEAAAIPVVAAMLTAFGGFGIQRLWAAIIPHGMQPDTFGLLKPSLGMLDFYLNVWPIAFGVFVPLILVAAWRLVRRKAWPSFETLALGAAVGAFATLSFAYQWPESRMTYIYVPLFIVALVSLVRDAKADAAPAGTGLPDLLVSASFLAALLIGLCIVPGDYWRPNLSQARFAPHQTWLANAIKAAPVDRYDLRIVCEGMDDVCLRADIEPQSDPYREMMIREYKRRRTE